MRPLPLRIVCLENGQGVAGSAVLASIVGTGFDTVTEVRFSGSGVRAQVLRPPSADRIDVVISIAADAAPGPRAILLLADHGGVSGTDLSGALFYVLARSSYTSASGIGSHLI